MYTINLLLATMSSHLSFATLANHSEIDCMHIILFLQLWHCVRLPSFDSEHMAVKIQKKQGSVELLVISQLVRYRMRLKFHRMKLLQFSRFGSPSANSLICEYSKRVL